MPWNADNGGAALNDTFLAGCFVLSTVLKPFCAAGNGSFSEANGVLLDAANRSEYEPFLNGCWCASAVALSAGCFCSGEASAINASLAGFCCAVNEVKLSLMAAILACMFEFSEVCTFVFVFVFVFCLGARSREYCLSVRQASSSANANSRTFGKRCWGSFSNARMTTFSTSAAVPGAFSWSDAGCASTCWLAISKKVP